MNIREIARMLGVAPSTVSIVLNNKKGVGRELRTKITEVLLENGYQIRKNDAELGVIEFLYYRNTNYVEDHHDDQFGSMLNGVERVAYHEKCKCTVVKTDDENLSNDIENINRDEKCKGAIFMASEYSGKVPGKLLECKKPLVVMDSSMDAYPVNTVEMNNAEGIRYICEYLRECGHKRVGYVRSILDNGCIITRHMQFKWQAEEAGLEIDPSISGGVSQLASAIGQDMEEYVSNLPYLPSAILTDNDFIALNLIKVLWKHGYRVPDDVSVVGFDDSPLCQYTVPRLTTVRVDFKEIGETAAKRLFEILKSGNYKEIRKIYIDLQFIKGESVRNLNQEFQNRDDLGLKRDRSLYH